MVWPLTGADGLWGDPMQPASQPHHGVELNVQVNTVALIGSLLIHFPLRSLVVVVVGPGGCHDATTPRRLRHWPFAHPFSLAVDSQPFCLRQPVSLF